MLVLFTIPLLTQLEYFIRIAAAAVFGGLIGLERERRAKSAGIKTHMIVALGSALIMIVSKYGFTDVLMQLDQAKLDPSRMAAGVVSAIGFLGAGIIFTKGFKIHGVTTAAGLWSTVGIGITFGAGLYAIAVMGTISLIIIQMIFHKVQIQFFKTPVNVNLYATGTMENLNRFRASLKEEHCSALKVSLAPTNEEGIFEMDIHFIIPNRNYEKRLMAIFNDQNLKVKRLDYEP